MLSGAGRRPAAERHLPLLGWAARQAVCALLRPDRSCQYSKAAPLSAGDRNRADGARPPLPLSPVRNRGEGALRSEEHTSELQSLMRISYAVFCLKKKHIITHSDQYIHSIYSYYYSLC